MDILYKIGSDPKSNAGRPILKSDLLGQVFTPAPLAVKMIENLLLEEIKEASYSLLDPCAGPMTFEKAWLSSTRSNDKANFTIIEIDSDFEQYFQDYNFLKSSATFSVLWNNFLTDYKSKKKFDYLIMNPPYIRQEWIDNKFELIEDFDQFYNVRIPGTSNLYSYFIVKALNYLKEGGKFSIIVYDSWENTKYGQWLKDFLLRNTTCLNVEHVGSQPFNGRLIDATIINGVKASINRNITNAEVLKANSSFFLSINGFKSINRLFKTKRGLRLKQSNFFMGGIEDLENGATPFLKKVNKVKSFYVGENHPESAYLISKVTKNRSKVIKILNKKIEKALKKPNENISIINWYEKYPETWFIHRSPEFAPIVFNYYLRNRPVHLYVENLHHSDNFYGLIPLENGFTYAYLAILNSTAVCIEILSHARNQGANLAKIQLFEYREVLIPDISILDIKTKNKFERLGRKLIKQENRTLNVIREIDNLVFETWKDERLNPINLEKEYIRIDNKAKKR